ncbi:MAG: hypothetical protein EA404_13435 [Spirochaetaceae bacterium]|nr:MAG: hypothetical protein EA404_13435 [Spirochaetaceae bacterium]
MSGQLHRPLLLVGVVLSLAAAPVAAGGWFRSNADAEALAPIEAAARSAHSWVLHVDQSPHETVRLLYHNGALVSEQRLDPDGALIERYEYRYRDGRRIEARAFRADAPGGDAGQPVYSDSYSYSSDGMLRELRRRYVDNSERSSRYVFVRGRLLEEQHRSGEMLQRLRYDSLERVQQLQQLRDDELVSSTRYYYRGDSARLEQTVEEQHDRDGVSVTSEYFDAEQRSIRSVVSRDERTVSVSERSHGPHGLIREVVTEPGRRRVSSFEYDQDGRLTQQEERVNERLQSRIIYPEQGRRIEERFHNGQLIVRLHFRNDEQTAREIIRDGEVIRSR